MKCKPVRPMKLLKVCCKLFYWSLFFTMSATMAQGPVDSITVFLKQHDGGYFYDGSIADSKYPLKNLFDSYFNTCWVSGSMDSKPAGVLFLEMPGLDSVELFVYNGYGKSVALYNNNARVKKVKFDLFYGGIPNGCVTERGKRFVGWPIEWSQVNELPDSIGIQRLQLNVDPVFLASESLRIQQSHCNRQALNITGATFVLRMEIIDVYPGVLYPDICLSEVCFNDALWTPLPNGERMPVSVLVNDKENSLVSKDLKGQESVVFIDSNSVLQLMEVSENKKWAIVNALPRELQGRPESNYILIDIINGVNRNSELLKFLENYQSGDMIFFGEDNLGRLVVVFIGIDGMEQRVLLR